MWVHSLAWGPRRYKLSDRDGRWEGEGGENEKGGERAEKAMGKRGETEGEARGGEGYEGG